MPRTAIPKAAPPPLEPYQVEEVAISQLQPHPQNYREHTPDQLEHLRQSLQAFGVYKNIVVARDNTILAGHGLVEAGQQLGLTTLPVRRMDLDPQEEEAIRLLVGDNETARLAIMQEQRLAGLLQGLAASPGGLLGTGYDAEAVAALVQQSLQGMTEAGTVQDVAPQLDRAEALREQWGVEPGQLWQLGRHRVLCGDCTEKACVERLLSGVVPLLMVTDPPYGVEYDAQWRNEAAERGLIAPAARRVGPVVADDRVDWRGAWQHFPGDVVYCWHAGRHASVVQASLAACAFEIRCQVVWAKQMFAISRGHYHWQHEPCWYAVRTGASGHWIGDRSQSTLWTIPWDKNVAGGHSTQKPLECMARPIRNHEAPEVYDPFLGSGTTLIACEQLGRQCDGMEIAPAYVAVTLQRWADATGQQPQRLE